MQTPRGLICHCSGYPYIHTYVAVLVELRGNVFCELAETNNYVGTYCQ